MKLTNAEIQKSIAELPDNIKQAVVTFDWAQEILEIAHEHNMQIDDADDFRHQTLLVILGKIRAEDYEKGLVSELGLSKDLAETLVSKANQRIFLALQKRAFPRNGSTIDTENTESTDVSGDPYQESITHNDVKNVLSSEGIELVDENEVQIFDNDLHNEVSAILSGTEKKSSLHVELDPTFKSEVKTQRAEDTPTSYNEPIDSSDLKGIHGHRTDTSIIRTQHQESPDNVFGNKPRVTGRDFGQGDYKIPTLDKHIMENPFATKTDIITATPTENEQIKKDGDFLSHLKEE